MTSTFRNLHISRDGCFACGTKMFRIRDICVVCGKKMCWMRVSGSSSIVLYAFFSCVTCDTTHFAWETWFFPAYQTFAYDAHIQHKFSFAYEHSHTTLADNTNDLDSEHRHFRIQYSASVFRMLYTNVPHASRHYSACATLMFRMRYTNVFRMRYTNVFRMRCITTPHVIHHWSEYGTLMCHMWYGLFSHALDYASYVCNIE